MKCEHNFKKKLKILFSLIYFRPKLLFSHLLLFLFFSGRGPLIGERFLSSINESYHNTGDETANMGRKVNNALLFFYSSIHLSWI